MNDPAKLAASTASPIRLGQLLTRSFVLVALAGVFATLIVVLTAGILLQRSYAQENLHLLARQAAIASAAPIAANDRAALAHALRPVIQAASVATVEVASTQGTRLFTAAGATRARGADMVPAALLPPPAILPVEVDGNRVGTVRLTGIGIGVEQLLLATIAGALLCIGTMAGAAALVVRRLRHEIVEPIEQMAGAAHAVRAYGGFHRRIPMSRVAELHMLASDFNGLLAQMEAWQEDVDSAHEALMHRASFDPLSGLPNRANFVERARAALRAAQRNGDRVGILFMDGDHFKATNDRFGHAAGDRMIEQIGARVPPLLRVGDVAARMGGDEFAVLIHHVEDEQDASSVARRIEEVMQQPVQVTAQQAVAVGLSIGIALYPDDGDDVEALIRAADQRMYAVKRQRKALR